MGSLTGAVVLALASSTFVLGTPFVNQLRPGQEFPQRNSVGQPALLVREQIQESSQPQKTVLETEDIKNEVAPVKLENIQTQETPIQKPEDTQNAVEDIVVIDANKESTKEIDSPDTETEKVQAEAESDAVLLKAANVKNEVPQKVDYTGAQLWKVSTEKDGVKQLLRNLRRRGLISTWAGNGTAIDVLVKPHAVENVTAILIREKVRYDVMIDNLQKMIDEENPPLDENELELQDRRGHRMNWKQYHRVEDIHGFMDYLAKTYPAIVSINTIGQSHEGRDLKMLRLSDGKPTNKAVFIDGGIHAREWISPATVTYFINQFAENFDVESDDVKNIDWYFVPVLNPDGYEYTFTGDRLWRKNRRSSYFCPGTDLNRNFGYFLPIVNPDGYEYSFVGDRLWRKNRRVSRSCSGVDLNRNFGYRWGGKGTSGNPCSEIYRGPRAFSEPESKAISDFFKSTAANFSAYLTYHSYGQYILYPWGYENVVPPDYKELDAVGKQMASVIQNTSGDKYTVGASSKTLYPAAGGSDDWAKAQGIKYSYTIELADTGRYGFVLPTSYIEPVAKSSLAALRLLAAQVNKE